MQILILDSVANMLRTITKNRGGCGVLLVHFYLFASTKQQNIVRNKSWVKSFRIAHGRLLLCLQSMQWSSVWCPSLITKKQELSHYSPLCPGDWEESHTLLRPRHHHCSWPVEDGIVLIGGRGSESSTEIAKWGGTVEELFTLKYETT